MSATLLVAQNLNHHRLRTCWTVLAVALIISCLLLLRTISTGWSASMGERRDDRVAVWNKTTYALTLPKSYVNDIAAVPGVKTSIYATFFEGFDPNLDETLQGFPILAVAPGYFDVYPEAYVAPEHMAAWRANPHSALVSEKLSKLLNYRVGDRVTLEGRNFPGTWHFVIAGVYRSDVKTFSDNLFLFHWEYLDAQISAADPRKNQISWLMSLVDFKQSTEIAKAIDRQFDSYDIQTQSMTEKSMIGMFMANFASALDAINFISVVLLAIAAIILGNTVSMGVRERKFQFGVLRAIGFTNSTVLRLILTEAGIVGLAGGIAGVLASYAVINLGLGDVIENNMGSLFPVFGVPRSAVAAGIVLPALLAIGAAILPALKALRVQVVQSLREVE